MTERPRQYTDDEVREHFLRHVWAMIEYWEHEDRRPTARAKLEGLAHSLLVAIDGGAAALPGFVLAPCPHKDDTEFHRLEGEDWYPRVGDTDHDIAGCLHELFYKFEPNKEMK